MKRKKSAISGQEVLTKLEEKFFYGDSYGGSCVDSNSSADRSSNPNSPFVPEQKISVWTLLRVIKVLNP